MSKMLSGEQFLLSFVGADGREHKATVASVGASLREYSVDGLNVVEPYGADSLPKHFSGVVLAPWPNRLEDGEYEFNCVVYNAPINEFDRNNQLHGFSQFYDFNLVAQTPTSVKVAAEIAPQKSYPFRLRVEVEYKLSDSGLLVEVVAKNLGTSALPYATGWHPWFSTRGSMDDAYLEISAQKVVSVNERLLPTGEESVETYKNGYYDFQKAKSLKGVALDDCWVDLVPTACKKDASCQKLQCRLTGADGHTTTVWSDVNCPAWQICNADGMGGDDKRFAIAIEPMTAYANAFRTGKHLIEIEPGAEVKHIWGCYLE
jgi:aldose 1-epimerase